MKKLDVLCLIVMNTAWGVLLLEHMLLHLELALPLTIIWSIMTLLFNIRVLLKCATTVSYST